MTDFERFTELVPEELKEKIPEKRMHHALWNLAEMIKEENPDLYAQATAEAAPEEKKQELTKCIEDKWQGVMEWHVKNGFISDADHPEEIKREPVPTDPEANRRVLACVKEEYMKKIPFFVRKHATEKTCELIAREFPDLYAQFKKEPDEKAKEEMGKLINAIFEERMQKHNI